MIWGERHHAEALREEVTAVLAPLGLRLSPEITRVVHIDEGFDFLGFTLRREGANVQIDPISGPGCGAESYQPGLGGWANYFRHAVAKTVFSDRTRATSPTT
ncbi:group II intron maturase-specific domain-containing protein [Amycolatopsis albispora]|uniref:group II intron maturase-specific domain-containing protein n=1 Tax=Amycolatopsis albispora TaxID=1804986 RepID=UPI0019664C90|nr:group II intron maturase-specific domain-containing protein [Amycolatopsis albispora]